jgi:hypothetical protein
LVFETVKRPTNSEALITTMATATDQGTSNPTDSSDKSKLDVQSVLAFLRDRGLHDTENLLQRELQNLNSSSSQTGTGIQTELSILLCNF